MQTRSSQFTKGFVFLGICAALAVSAAGQTPTGRVTGVVLRPPTLPKPGSPCGGQIYLDGDIITTGPVTVWYRFLMPPGVQPYSNPETVFELKHNGTLGFAGVGIMQQDFKGPFRVEAATQGRDGKRGPVFQSNIVMSEGKCSGSSTAAASRPASPAASTPANASANGLPSELPLPPGATTTRVEHMDFGQDEFSYPNANRTTDYVKVAGHLWRAFLKGDQTSLGVPAWKAALEPAGWQILNQTPGNTVARRGDWWAKIGLDRLTLVQRVDAEALPLAPPGDKIEELTPNQDLPYVTPLPNTKRIAWKTEENFELKGNKDPEPRMLGPAVYLRYEGGASLSAVEVQTRYNAALQKAGWDVVRSDPGGLTGAHYTQHGRDVWLKLTPLPGGYLVEVADLGAAAGQDKLAKALDDAGHIALYGIYFDSDKATLRPDSEPTLVQIQKLLAGHASMKLEIQGHTDNTGTRSHNDTLSDERAAAVKAWLVAHGIPGARLTSKGYADTKPVAPNGTPQGRALNRRVELARP
jgi:OOP family OmpA-OmpF porin